MGSFGEWQPLLQYSGYDRNHSSSLSAGLRFKNNLAGAYVDYTIDERNDKGLDGAGKPKDFENKTHGVVVYGEFFTEDWSPYLHYSTTNLDEFTSAAGSEIKTNKDGSVNDNEQMIGTGVFYEGYGKLYRPYLGVASTSGKYVDSDVSVEEESRTKFDIMLGLTGNF